jgi:hypothetical protein
MNISFLFGVDHQLLDEPIGILLTQAARIKPLEQARQLPKQAGHRGGQDRC